MKTRITAIVTFIILIVLVVWVSLFVMADRPQITTLPTVTDNAPAIPATTTPSAAEVPPPVVEPQKPIIGNIVVHIGETGTLGDTTITPSEVIEDSRCPLGVMCIQAGRVRIDAAVHVGAVRTKQTFLVGEPFTFEGKIITLTLVEPLRRKEVTPKTADYVLTFRVEPVVVRYINASPDLIKVTSLPVGAVVGKQFEIRGEARGSWFFEASFPVVVRGAKGEVLAETNAKAGADWMTTAFVPFTATVTIPDTYTGDAAVMLKKDNPSGVSAKDASYTFPIHIAY